MPTTDATIDPSLEIIVSHSAYYRWIPCPEADLVAVVDDSGDTQWYTASDVVDGVIVDGALAQTTVESTYPEFRMRRVRVEEPTQTTTSVHLPSLSDINQDRIAAGLARRTHRANLIRHLEDGPWYKHFPEDSVTGVTASDPQWQKWLSDHFASDDASNEPDYSVATPSEEVAT